MDEIYRVFLMLIGSTFASFAIYGPFSGFTIILTGFTIAFTVIWYIANKEKNND